MLAGGTLMTATRRTQQMDPRSTASRRDRTIMNGPALLVGFWQPRRSSRLLLLWTNALRSCVKSNRDNMFSPPRFGRNYLSLADRRALDRPSLIFPRT